MESKDLIHGTSPQVWKKQQPLLCEKWDFAARFNHDWKPSHPAIAFFHFPFATTYFAHLSKNESSVKLIADAVTVATTYCINQATMKNSVNLASHYNNRHNLNRSNSGFSNRSSYKSKTSTSIWAALSNIMLIKCSWKHLCWSALLVCCIYLVGFSVNMRNCVPAFVKANLANSLPWIWFFFF